jgi:hypothetical protein
MMFLYTSVSHMFFMCFRDGAYLGPILEYMIEQFKMFGPPTKEMDANGAGPERSQANQLPCQQTFELRLPHANSDPRY